MKPPLRLFLVYIYLNTATAPYFCELTNAKYIEWCSSLIFMLVFILDHSHCQIECLRFLRPENSREVTFWLHTKDEVA